MADVENNESQIGSAEAFIKQVEENNSPQIPEKFKGKSLEDVIQSYTELERERGRQAQELGELRKLTDAYIRSELQNRRQPEPEPTAADNDLDLSDPELSRMKKLLDKEMSPIKAEYTELKKEKFLNKLSQKHSDYQQIINDGDFQNWVTDSPLRVELFKRADMQFDYDSANEIFDMWKQKKGIQQDVEDRKAATTARNEAFEKSQMEITSSDVPPSSKKVYRRADIMDLRMRDPERYRALESEILLAYAEKRVV